MSRVLNLLLTHQEPVAISRMLAWWRECCPVDNVLVAFCGSAEAFERIEHPWKVLVDDPRLRTVRHSRERQSYGGVLRAARDWLAGRDFTHVHFAEYDQVPLVPDVNERQVSRLEEERADVLAFELARVDGTNQPHLLYHAHLPGFFPFWESVSVRADRGVILSMFGSGSFWTRGAFEAVAGREEPFPIYLELYLPTLAHHLGYRLRDWREQNDFISSLGNRVNQIAQARAAGAWTLHPVKTLWTSS